MRVRLISYDDWERILELGVLPAIRRPQDYVREVNAGLDRAATFLEERGSPGLDLTTLSYVHYEIFQNIHPWAGCFRERGQLPPPNEEAEIGFGPFTACDFRLVEDNLKSWFKTAHGLLQSKQLQETCEAIAIVHLSIKREQPFMDGNTRVGGLILQWQLQNELGIALPNPSPREHEIYRKAVGLSAIQGHPKPLLEFFAASIPQLRCLTETLAEKRASTQLAPKVESHIETRRVEQALVTHKMKL